MSIMAPGVSVLVLGAGELGLAVLEALSQHPKRQEIKLTVLLRAPTISSTDTEKQKKNEHLESLGIDFEAGDIVEDSHASLVSLFRRYHTVISCTGMGLPPGTQAKVARAVLEAGVARYFPWQWGVDYDVIGANSAQDLFDEQLQVRAMLRTQEKTNWIIVSTGLFMSFLFLPAFGPVDLQSKALRALGSWDNKVTVTTPKDIGIMTAEIVYEPGEINRQVVFVGSDTVSYGQVADLVVGKVGGGFKRQQWTMDILQQRLVEQPEDVMTKYQTVFGAGRGVAWDMTETLNFKRNIRLQSVEEYVQATM